MDTILELTFLVYLYIYFYLHKRVLLGQVIFYRNFILYLEFKSHTSFRLIRKKRRFLYKKFAKKNLLNYAHILILIFISTIRSHWFTTMPCRRYRMFTKSHNKNHTGTPERSFRIGNPTNRTFAYKLNRYRAGLKQSNCYWSTIQGLGFERS